MTLTVIQPGDIARPGGEPPVLLCPSRESVFADRTRRFAQLAGLDSHATLAEWLGFLGHLTAAQDAALKAFPAVPLPDEKALALAAEYHMPPLAAYSWKRDPAWREALAAILDAVAAAAPLPAQDVIRRLRALPVERLEALATQILGHDANSPDERAAAPFVAAALQVYWTHLAAQMPAAALAKLENKNLCPVCGSLATGSVLRLGANEAESISGLRYLHCSLCNSEWNVPRATCSQCETTSAVAYHSIEGEFPSVRAETCDGCHGYLKIYAQEKDPLVDPIADDIATMALDVLVDELGYERCGPNFLLVPG